MPWHIHKNSKLVSHYGRWTKQEENDFYSEISFENWKGSSGVVPRSSKASLLDKNKEVKDVIFKT